MSLTHLRRTLGLTAAAAVLALLTACSSTGTSGTHRRVRGTSVVAAAFSTPADTHADADDGDYSPDGATTITLADGASTVDGAGAAVQGDVVTITAAGTYLVSGTLSDGQLVVDSPGEGKVKIVLDGRPPDVRLDLAGGGAGGRRGGRDPGRRAARTPWPTRRPRPPTTTGPTPRPRPCSRWPT